MSHLRDTQSNATHHVSYRPPKKPQQRENGPPLLAGPICSVVDDTPFDPSDHHRAVFHQAGLAYGRNLGSKGRYARNSSRRFFVANAAVLTRNGSCVWRGDVDLGEVGDRQSLIAASRMLNAKLFIVREGGDEIRSLPRSWLAATAVADVWRGRVETTGYTRKLHGALEQIIKRTARSGRRGLRGGRQG